VFSTPPHSGAPFLTSQTSLPVFGSIARIKPMSSSFSVSIVKPARR